MDAEAHSSDFETGIKSGNAGYTFSNLTANGGSWNGAPVQTGNQFAVAFNGSSTGPTAGLFRGERLPDGLSAEALLAAGVEIEQERAARRSAD